MEEGFVEGDGDGMVSSMPGFFDAGVEAALRQQNRAGVSSSVPPQSGRAAAVPEDGESGTAVVFAVITRGQR